MQAFYVMCSPNKSLVIYWQWHKHPSAIFRVCAPWFVSILCVRTQSARSHIKQFLCCIEAHCCIHHTQSHVPPSSPLCTYFMPCTIQINSLGPCSKSIKTSFWCVYFLSISVSIHFESKYGRAHTHTHADTPRFIWINCCFSLIIFAIWHIWLLWWWCHKAFFYNNFIVWSDDDNTANGQEQSSEIFFLYILNGTSALKIHFSQWYIAHIWVCWKCTHNNSNKKHNTTMNDTQSKPLMMDCHMGI